MFTSGSKIGTKLFASCSDSFRGSPIVWEWFPIALGLPICFRLGLRKTPFSNRPTHSEGNELSIARGNAMYQNSIPKKPHGTIICFRHILDINGISFARGSRFCRTPFYTKMFSLEVSGGMVVCVAVSKHVLDMCCILRAWNERLSHKTNIFRHVFRHYFWRNLCCLYTTFLDPFFRHLVYLARTKRQGV